MLEINMEDVYTILRTCIPYIVAIVIAIAAAVIITIAVRKQEAAGKSLIRKESWIAALIAVVTVLNLVCAGPLNDILTLTSKTGGLEEETIAEAGALGETIEGEGITLLKNEGNLLPLDGGRINVFGWASTNPVFGGTGSGSMSMDYERVDLLQGLENSGLEVNSELTDFYTAYAGERPKLSAFKQDWTLPEPTADSYSSELIRSAQEFSDTAMIVFSRSGGENFDLPTDMSDVIYENNSAEYADFEAGAHYLELSQTEKNLVDLVCSDFDHVIVVYNGSNAMELGFTEEYEQIESVLWVPSVGQTGFNALGKILTGEINPSGKTSDTFVYDLTAAPYFSNIGSFVYDNMDEFAFTSQTGDDAVPTFVNYNEGIYVGYRFYETAAEEGLIAYEDCVQYPFGYGMSYTGFRQTMSDLTVADDIISFDVTVTNEGERAGKDVVEVYCNPPYENGGIEKASANLLDFAKTSELQPGESETITMTMNIEDMASYDSSDAGNYVLESGEYGISIRSDSHTVIDEKIYTVADNIVYNGDNKRDSDDTAAVNQFADDAGDVTYLSRADGFANFEEATAAPENYSLSDEYKNSFVANNNYNAEDYNDDADEMPTMGADNGLELADLVGLDYDDAQWELLLDELTYDDMKNLVGRCGYHTPEVESIGKVETTDVDGPQSIVNNFSGASSVGMPGGVTIACIWNKDLSYAFGQMMGKMADELDVTGWYAPAMNIHRSAFGGRNFEYYSEDGVLGGMIAAQTVTGCQEQGVYCYIKHFALNEQDTNRTAMLCTWAEEQSIREIYLKPFELAVKIGDAHAVMSSLNMIGITPTSGDSNLLNNVLRDEWGFRGFVITDTFSGKGYFTADRMIKNGNDALLTNFDNGLNIMEDQSATAVLAMRQASKNILYTVANSRAYTAEEISAGLAMWQIIVICVDILTALIAVLGTVFAVRKYRKSKRQ